jgi:glutamate--cysteine ligase
MSIARSGLSARRHLDPSGRDETVYLDVLEPIVETGLTQADRLITQFNRDWKEDIRPVFDTVTF